MYKNCPAVCLWFVYCTQLV